jgi:hypothetical protein
LSIQNFFVGVAAQSSVVTFTLLSNSGLQDGLFSDKIPDLGKF